MFLSDKCSSQFSYAYVCEITMTCRVVRLLGPCFKTGQLRMFHCAFVLPGQVSMSCIISGLFFLTPDISVCTCPHLQRTTIARADTSLYCVMDQWQHSLSQRLYERSLAGLRLRSNRTSILCCQPAGASLPAGNATRSTLLMKLRSALWWHTSLKA